MICPFPGMDPYLERPEIWPDFHDRLITRIAETLQPHLRPRYAALSQHRLYVVEHQRPIRPDVGVLQTSQWDDAGGVTTSVAVDVDTHVVVEIYEEEVRQSVIHIVEPAAGNRIVSAIEVLSPDNKKKGDGRDTYLAKQDELWRGQTHLVEIDLLYCGTRVVRVSDQHLASLGTFQYLVSVSRQPRFVELYPIPLPQRLPRIGIPLAEGDQDVVLDLQGVFERCWQAGPYPELLHYDDPPPGYLPDELRTWCHERLGRIIGAE